MDVNAVIDRIKKHPDYPKVGMILAHNGVVRETTRDGLKVTGLTVSVDHDRLKKIIETEKQSPGIVDIIVEINEERHLAVGDDVMVMVVAGDIRDHVIATLERTLNEVKQTVTRKTEFLA
jgi:molybdopterin synthase catalytic subunit